MKASSRRPSLVSPDHHWRGRLWPTSQWKKYHHAKIHGRGAGNPGCHTGALYDPETLDNMTTTAPAGPSWVSLPVFVVLTSVSTALLSLQWRHWASPPSRWLAPHKVGCKMRCVTRQNGSMVCDCQASPSPLVRWRLQRAWPVMQWGRSPHPRSRVLGCTRAGRRHQHKCRTSWDVADITLAAITTNMRSCHRRCQETLTCRSR